MKNKIIILGLAMVLVMGVMVKGEKLDGLEGELLYAKNANGNAVGSWYYLKPDGTLKVLSGEIPKVEAHNTFKNGKGVSASIEILFNTLKFYKDNSFKEVFTPITENGKTELRMVMGQNNIKTDASLVTLGSRFIVIDALSETKLYSRKLEAGVEKYYDLTGDNPVPVPKPTGVIIRQLTEDEERDTNAKPLLTTVKNIVTSLDPASTPASATASTASVQPPSLPFTLAQANALLQQPVPKSLDGIVSDAIKKSIIDDPRKAFSGDVQGIQDEVNKVINPQKDAWKKEENDVTSLLADLNTHKTTLSQSKTDIASQEESLTNQLTDFNNQKAANDRETALGRAVLANLQTELDTLNKIYGDSWGRDRSIDDIDKMKKLILDQQQTIRELENAGFKLNSDILTTKGYIKDLSEDSLNEQINGVTAAIDGLTKRQTTANEQISAFNSYDLASNAQIQNIQKTFQTPQNFKAAVQMFQNEDNVENRDTQKEQSFSNMLLGFSADDFNKDGLALQLAGDNAVLNEFLKKNGGSVIESMEKERKDLLEGESHKSLTANDLETLTREELGGIEKPDGITSDLINKYREYSGTNSQVALDLKSRISATNVLISELERLKASATTEGEKGELERIITTKKNELRQLQETQASLTRAKVVAVQFTENMQMAQQSGLFLTYARTNFKDNKDFKKNIEAISEQITSQVGALEIDFTAFDEETRKKRQDQLRSLNLMSDRIQQQIQNKELMYHALAAQNKKAPADATAAPSDNVKISSSEVDDAIVRMNRDTGVSLTKDQIIKSPPLKKILEERYLSQEVDKEGNIEEPDEEETAEMKQLREEMQALTNLNVDIEYEKQQVQKGTVQAFLTDIKRWYGEFSGLSGWSRVLIKSGALTKWQQGIDEFFDRNVLGIEPLTSKICQSKVKKAAGDGALLVHTPGGVVPAAFIAGERQTTQHPNGTYSFTYKVSYMVNIPPSTSDQLGFAQTRGSGASPDVYLVRNEAFEILINSRPLFTDSETGSPVKFPLRQGGSTGDLPKVFSSKNYYTEVCIKMGQGIPFAGKRTDKLCKQIVETGLNVPLPSIPRPQQPLTFPGLPGQPGQQQGTQPSGTPVLNPDL